MLVYLAGPLFSIAQRRFLDDCARLFRGAGLECFVPHEHELALGQVTARTIFELDYAALNRANAVVAWLDGDAADDGTACEVGIFVQLMQRGEPHRKGVVGLCTDIRRHRLRVAEEYGGANLFLAGAIASVGRVCWTLEDVLEQLLAWRDALEAPRA
jgi:nucleoside 2-deoxyribosyltransferase